MRANLKRVSNKILVPLVKWYLRKERRYTYNGINIRVMPGVFHPGLFYSTRFLLYYLENQNLAGKTVLELGCGTGLISIECARRGAVVTAVDLSTIAVNNTRLNAGQNQVDINIIKSDLFKEVTPMTFDWIVINPPYYPRVARNEAELAWYCGEDFQFFGKLFSQLRDYAGMNTVVIMVLTKGCEISRIKKLASGNGFDLQMVAETDVLFDGKDYLFQVKSTHLGNAEFQ